MSKYVFEINPLSVGNLTTGKKVYLTWKTSAWEKGKTNFSLVDLSGTAIFGNPIVIKETMHAEKGSVDVWKSKKIYFKLLEKMDGKFLTNRDRVVARGSFNMGEYVNSEGRKLTIEMTREKLKVTDSALGFGVDPVLNLKVTSNIVPKDEEKKQKKKNKKKKANDGGGEEEKEQPRVAVQQ